MNKKPTFSLASAFIGFMLLFSPLVFGLSIDENTLNSLTDEQKQEALKRLGATQQTGTSLGQNYKPDIEITRTTSSLEKQVTNDKSQDGIPNNFHGSFDISDNYHNSQNPKEQLANSDIKPWQSNSLESQKAFGLSNAPIEQFGYSFFSKIPQKSFEFTNVPVGDNYTIGPGDQLIIRLWGKLEETIEVTVDSAGQIYLPKVGSLTVSGENFGGVKKLIKKNLESYYVNFELNVTLSKLRSIKVFVLGETLKPGAYDVSSISTLIMALYAAGGPTKKGSLRKIKLKQRNGTEKIIDLYDYLLYGNQEQDVRLSNLDTIFIPPIGGTVVVEGFVKRQGIFEITTPPTVYDAIKTFGGGMQAMSYQKNIELTQIDKNGNIIVENIKSRSEKELIKNLKNKKITDGAKISVKKISNQKYNVVSVVGNVYRPGDYAFSKHMTVKSLIDNAEGMLPNSILDKIDIYRYISPDQKEIISCTYETSNSIKLKEWDIVKVYSHQEVHGLPLVYIDGFVKKPGKFQLPKNGTIKDALFWAGIKNDVSDFKVELSRKTNRAMETYQFYKNDILNGDSPFKLERNDRLTVLILNNEEEIKTVKLRGQVKYPGNYVLEKNETLKSLLKRAGGLTEKAYVNGLILKRKAVADQLSERQKIILKEEKKRLIYDQTNEKSRSRDRLENSIDFVNATLEAYNGRVVFNNIDETINSHSAKKAIKLENQDNIFIPEAPTSVQIVGGVLNPISILYENKHKNMAYYIDQAGGFSEFAVPHRIYVIRANGVIELNSKEVYAGDTIYISEDIKVSTDWLAVISNVSSTIFNIVTTLKIVGVIN